MTLNEQAEAQRQIILDAGVASNEQLVVAEPAPVTPLSMLQIAVQRGASIEQMAQLMDLQERHERNEARKAFVVALNAFKADPPDITKNKLVSFTTSKGTTSYKHATLDQVSRVIGAALAKVGISHRWDTEQLEGGRIRVTCVLTHSLRSEERRVGKECRL